MSPGEGTAPARCLSRAACPRRGHLSSPHKHTSKHARETTWKARRGTGTSSQSATLEREAECPGSLRRPIPRPHFSPPRPLLIPSRAEEGHRLSEHPTHRPAAESTARDDVLSSWVLGKKTAMDNCTDQNLAQRSIGFFRVPGLFVRLSSKGLNAVDPDSVWSPTSPLDFKNLSSNAVGTNLKPTGLLGIEADLLKLRTGSPRVGLGLVDALTDDESSLHFEGKNSFLESIRPFLELGLPKVAADASSCQKTGSPDAAMNENTDFVHCDCEDEEYTCVIKHGPNPRTTHILRGQTVEVPKGVRSKRPIFTIEPIDEQSWPSMPADGAASGSCSFCRKRLREDMDTFMYLGEKAFCSNECRKCCVEEEIDEVELMMLDDSGGSADLRR